MRLKSIFISEYKNLKDFSLSFDGEGFLDIFVGKNGTGKSNLFEALTEIFNHIYGSTDRAEELEFHYRIEYQIEGDEVSIGWNGRSFDINGEKSRKTIGRTPLPDNVLIYYSGHNTTISDTIERYRTSFRRSLRRIDEGDSRRFIGVGSEYRELLLASILMRPSASRAKRFLMSKLGIKSLGETATLMLDPPYFVRSSEPIDPIDPANHFWGADGVLRIFLDKLTTCVKGGFSVGELYDRERNRYSIPIDVERFQKVFADDTASNIFRHFDNLKTAQMLREIKLPIELGSGLNATISHFSDGQFQSVYIYSLIEIFKDRNCITLLDEPDSFLHPEWQFDFLKQIFEITDNDAAKNHVLMSSHSASTIASQKRPLVNLFEFNGQALNVRQCDKAEVIKTLSAGLITFSENEARLNIAHVLKNTTQPILFTEGITDEIILETAWVKLYGEKPRPFEIQNAFSAGFLRNLVKDASLYTNHPARKFFALFDFDEAYNDWVQLGDEFASDPSKCLVKKRNGVEGYALLLPVPGQDPIRSQVINSNTGNHYGGSSLLTIELLFHGVEGAEAHFVHDESRPDRFIKFTGDKVRFAKEVVPALDSKHFEPIRPIFDFVLGKI